MNVLTKIEPTPTGTIRGVSASQDTRRDRDVDRDWPQTVPATWLAWTLVVPILRRPSEEALLKVAMTFEGNIVRMEAVDIGISVEGRRVPEVVGRLREAVGAYLETSGDERAELLRYPADAWFKIVLPNQTAFADKATFADGIISALNHLYEFKSDLVKVFLEENLALSGLLLEAYGVIREHFGPEVEMALEVVTDPEALGDQQLFVLIRTELPRREARAHHAELDRGWWLNALPATEGKMEIALD